MDALEAGSPAGGGFRAIDSLFMAESALSGLTFCRIDGITTGVAGEGAEQPAQRIRSLRLDGAQIASYIQRVRVNRELRQKRLSRAGRERFRSRIA